MDLENAKTEAPPPLDAPELRIPVPRGPLPVAPPRPDKKAVEISIDVSIGLAVFPTDSREAAGLLAAADAAMYVGKNALIRVA